ncbi:hypothetical protein LTR10_014747 [Elasticomyces elasticus]|uniref:Guanine nucleotide-exchange factor SEC12 n=1 Tax=Exophiala sideris TaxID=1016849 RepID=A0ABR0J8L0_9EURO|nr:hypothetical protein LTR10_014747 [Elasticomyces elasticus]KAK5029392.1 hypothetical protein LTS07_005854 [Exophiala sideris]KAK5058022.1 hypothetical protein LTR69_007019 [Exophiala sideris]KAK5181981.1 hypothetical protein LTR44_005582 [Eurotiomycetes sp. CCFEE 6388]
MAPTVSSAQSKLSYPLYAADFDPYNPDFLLVGGGGGSSSTGVPNKISLIDTSRRDQLTEVVDVELVKGEDSVTSLAVSDSLASCLTAFAGINSSIADQNAGKNEHLRSFRIGLPAKKRRADGTTVDGAEKPASQPQSSQALGRTALFKSASGTKRQPRIAAIASGLAPENEIIVFQPTPIPTQKDEISRIDLGKREAADLDLNVNVGEKEGHILAYCTDDEVFVQQLPGSSKPASPKSLYRTTESTTSLPPSKRPKFRAVRFLSPRYLLLLQNRPGRTGADLLVLRITNDLSQSRTSLRKRLHSSTKAAVGLDVCHLTSSSLNEYQIIIAVAGQSGDASSIELLTMDYSDAGVGTFRPYTLLRNVHSGPLTRLVFSNFIGPTLPITKETPPQSIRLASVGVDMNVVVQYLPLRPYPPSSKTPRYVLTPPGRSEAMQTTFSVFVALVVVSIVAFLMQAFCEIRGVVPPMLGAPNWLSPRMRNLVARPWILGENISSVAYSDIPVAAHSAAEKVKEAIVELPSDIANAASDLKQKLQDLVQENSQLETPKAIIVREASMGELSTEVAADADLVQRETLKKWEELSETDQKSWKQKLIDAGYWAEQQGENVLEGIFFSGLGGIVGNIVGGQ